MRSPPVTPLKLSEESQWPKLPERHINSNGVQSESTGLGGPVKLFPSPMFIPKLERCVIIYTRKRSSSDEIWEALSSRGEVAHVICKAPFEFLVFFHLESDKVKFLECQKWNQEEWKVVAWNEEEPQHNRVASITVRGIPPQAWSEKSVRAIAEKFGRVLELITDMEKMPDYLEVFLTIETNVFKIIKEEIDVIFDNKIVAVGIVECWTDELGTSYGGSKKVEKADSHNVGSGAATGVPAEMKVHPHATSLEPLVTENVEPSGIGAFGSKKENKGTLADTINKEAAVGGSASEFKWIMNGLRGVDVQIRIGAPMWNVALSVDVGIMMRWCLWLSQSVVRWQFVKRQLSNKVVEGVINIVDYMESNSENKSGLDVFQNQVVAVVNSNEKIPADDYPSSASSDDCVLVEDSSGKLPAATPSAQHPKNFSLEVLLTPDTPVHSLQRNGSTEEDEFAELCLEYGKRLNCSIPFPELSKQNYARVLRRSERVFKKSKMKNGGSSGILNNQRRKKDVTMSNSR